MRTHRVALLIGSLFAAAVALVQCNGADLRASAGGGGDADASDAAGDAVVFPDAAPMGFADSAPAQPPLDAGDPPSRACDDGGDAADDAGPCPLPHSVCADNDWLVYYTGGDCVGGACAWEKHFLRCSISCVKGQCQILGTK